MTITFSINFHTAYGENLYLTGNIPELGNGDPDKAVKLEYSDSFDWSTSLNISCTSPKELSYIYFVKRDDGNIISEKGSTRNIILSPDSKHVIISDQWQGNDSQGTFLTAPFENVFFKREQDIIITHTYKKEIIIRATIPAVDTDSRIYICGESESLGQWNPEKALEMKYCGGSRWAAAIDCTGTAAIVFKFVRKGAEGIVWEECENRQIPVRAVPDNGSMIFEFSSAGFRLPKPRFAGTAIPLFSLRSKDGYGIGDFTDIKRIADWARRTGQSIIQLLPINDTTSTSTWTDSYPYSGISVMALHPIYLNPKEVGKISDSSENAGLEEERIRLNALDKVDYDGVLALKRHYIDALYREYGQETEKLDSYKTFMDRNRSWLLPYAAFCTLRDRFGTADFSLWKGFSTYYPEIPEELLAESTETKKQMLMHIFVQYHLDRQLSDAVRYAHSQGVALKGDIPIGITPESVEAWTEPQFFHMDSQAGAPPDDFSVNGQNWGFPTYDWEAMSRDRYGWWKRRFTKMSEYFDIYRIDHVLGFFRIWEIPKCEITGLMGHFSPALPFTEHELRSRGLAFDIERMTRPYIRPHILSEVFGELADKVTDTFMYRTDDDSMALKPEFDTQRKISEYFMELKSPEDIFIRDGLIYLASNLLFLEDPRKKGYYHPRISMFSTHSYRDLPDGQKKICTDIYNDFFYHRHNDFWWKEAMMKMPELISATDMLTCAEDLGMIPACVPDVLERLHIATLEIQRMSKNPEIQFADTYSYPYLSVCTTGTHDTSTLRGWWEEDRASSQKYYNEILHEYGQAPYFCEPWICEKIVRMHLESPSMLTILPLQDWFSIDWRLRVEDPESERINIPSNPKHYWRFRMNICLEDLLADDEFNDRISGMIAGAGR